MITSAFPYLAMLLVTAGLLRFFESKSQYKIFDILPAIVILYFLVMLMSTFGLWQKTAEINAAYKGVKSNVLPAMIFLMLLNADLRQIKKLGAKIIFAFLTASFTIGIAFIIAFALFLPMLEADSWKTFAALSGSWMGGTGNMAAIQLALNVPDSSMGYTLLIDSIDYAIWVMLLLSLVPYSKRFNQWIGTNTENLDEISKNLTDKNTDVKGDQTPSLLLLLGLALFISAVTQHLAQMLPATVFLTSTTWTVLMVTVLGVVCAMTPLSKLYGASEISNIMLYLIVALIASRANFAELTQAPMYILMGLVILFIHGLLMLIAAKIFKFDLFTCGIASLANIGGIASAPLLAAAYSKSLIPVGVLMALLGYIVGTAGGLFVGKVLSLL
ncbi:MAG: DUF819 family protein [Colwellia sp.]